MWLLSFPVSWLSDFALTKGVDRAVIRKVSNSIGHWGPGIMLLILCFVDTRNRTVIVAVLIAAVGLNAAAICGFQINHIDLSPNHAGTMMSITNCISNVVSILAPLITGHIVTDQVGKNVNFLSLSFEILILLVWPIYPGECRSVAHNVLHIDRHLLFGQSCFHHHREGRNPMVERSLRNHAN